MLKYNVKKKTLILYNRIYFLWEKKHEKPEISFISGKIRKVP